MEFPTTRLSLVLAAASSEQTRAQNAMAELCRIYWNPLCSYVRSQVHDRAAAEDLTQSFIARMIEKDALRHFSRERGRFRSFLLMSLKNFLANERDSAEAQKRGGGMTFLPLEQTDAQVHETPDRLFERQWALEVLNRAVERVRAESTSAGRAGQFERLKVYLTGEGELARYRDLGEELGMTENAVKVMIHRLRQRFHQAIREEISMTVTDEAAIGEEIRYLIAVLGA
jgi:RNA polymerase sigma-70 factor (ECF subfamily)